MVIERVLDTDHLNEQHIALYVEAMLLDRVHLLPRKVRKHIAACDDCSMRVIRLYKLMKAFSTG